jgi:hypothetical protein
MRKYMMNNDNDRPLFSFVIVADTHLTEEENLNFEGGDTYGSKLAAMYEGLIARVNAMNPALSFIWATLRILCRYLPNLLIRRRLSTGRPKCFPCPITWCPAIMTSVRKSTRPCRKLMTRFR